MDPDSKLPGCANPPIIDAEPVDDFLNRGQEPLELQVAHPTWLHWTSLFFDILSHSRTYLIPAVIGVLSAAKGNSTGMIFAALFFIPSIILSVFRYFTLRYSIHNRQLIVVQGLIHRSVRTVPVARIQNIDLVQNVLHRLFHVAEVRIETASGKEPEAVLRVLSLQQVENLRNEIFQLAGHQTPETESANEPTQFTQIPQQPAQPNTAGSRSSLESNHGLPAIGTRAKSNSLAETLVEIPISWLIRAGLASDRGMIMVGLGLGLMYQFDVFDRVSLGSLRKLIPQNLDRLSMVLAGVVAFGILLILLRVLGISWYLLRFFGFRLQKRGDDLQISCGLLTKVSASVPRTRIQLISVQRNLLLRWMGLTSIRIETAGSTAHGEDASKSVSRRWFLPVLADQLQPQILDSLRPNLTYQPDLYQWVKLSPKAFARRIRIIVLISILLGAIGIYYLPPWGGFVGVAALVLLGLNAYFEIRSTRYARTEEGLVFESGYLTQKTTFTFFHKFQSIRVDQSPFDRRWKMARLTIDTAGAGPAEHALAIAPLDSDFAMQEHRSLTKLAAQHQPSFA
jgi:putative membrane protein